MHKFVNISWNRESIIKNIIECQTFSIKDMKFKDIILQYITQYHIRRFLKLRLKLLTIDGLVQDCSISSALAMEILFSCTQPSIISISIECMLKVVWVLEPVFRRPQGIVMQCRIWFITLYAAHCFASMHCTECIVHYGTFQELSCVITHRLQLYIHHGPDKKYRYFYIRNRKIHTSDLSEMISPDSPWC